MFTALSVLRVRSYAGGLAASLSLLLLAACGGGDDAPPAPPPPPPPAVVAPSALSYTSPVNATIGVAITTLTPTVTGTAPTYAVSPALPAGLAISNASGAITGTPTSLAATATYTITATNSAGNTTFPLSLTVGTPVPTAYAQSNLVSDGSISAARSDPQLVNPWGLVFATGAPSWLVNNVTNTSTLYDGTGLVQPLIVTIPVVILVLIFQRRIVAGLTAGAVKG